MTAKRARKTAKPTRVFGLRQEPVKMFRVGLYARVSTHDQQTLPLQVRAMRNTQRSAGGRLQLRSKRLVPERLNANCGNNCWLRLDAAKSMSFWSGGLTAGADHSPTWSSPCKIWRNWALVSYRSPKRWI